MANYKILTPADTYKGLSYGDLVARWTNWVFSDDPDSTEFQGDLLFLRGNLRYFQDLVNVDRTRVSMTGKKKGELGKWAPFYDRTGDSSILISRDTAILVPVLTDTEFFGGPSEVGTAVTEEQARTIATTNTNESGPIWATVESSDGKRKRLCGGDLTDYRITSPVFKLWISEKNPYWKDILQYPINPGEYNAVTDGFFILAMDLQEGSYRIRFGGKGRLSHNYRTESIYDIHVTNTFLRKSTVTDISENTNTLWLSPTEVGGIPNRDDLPALIDYKKRHKAKTPREISPSS